jgi:hypothetical protein
MKYSVYTHTQNRELFSHKRMKFLTGYTVTNFEYIILSEINEAPKYKNHMIPFI